MLAWLKGAKPTKDYSAEQQTMPARMEKKIYQQNWRQCHQWLKKKDKLQRFYI